MVDCLQGESLRADSIFSHDGTIENGFGCLTATIQRCLLSDHVDYDIQIKHPRGHSWCVTRRYREFRALRDSLRKTYALPDEAWTSFPTRKLFNNLSPTFVCQRSRHLEAFLNHLLLHYTLPPPPMVEFLEWERYDVHGITNALARQIFKDGDSYLTKNLLYCLQVYQLSSINTRTISPVPMNLFNRDNENFGHVLGFVSKLRRLKLTGSIEKLYQSNVALNTLHFDMSPFRSLKYLELNNVDLKRMRGFEHIKATVTQLVVHHSLKNLKNLMLGDLFAAGDGDWVYGENPVATLPWDQIKFADFSNNFLHSIDQTIALLPMVEILNLSNNLLTEIADLTALRFLRVLYLAENQLYLGEEAGWIYATTTANGCTEPAATGTGGDSSAESGQLAEEGFTLGCTSFSVGTSDSSTAGRGNGVGRARKPPALPLRSRLGDVQVLVLANNGLRSANVVAGLVSLQHLDLSNNKIESLGELLCLGELPHLNSVELSGNPLCDYPYYRRNVLDLLGDRFSLILLDGQRANLAELEAVQLYRALKQGGATPYLSSPDSMNTASTPAVKDLIRAGTQDLPPVTEQKPVDKLVTESSDTDLNSNVAEQKSDDNPTTPLKQVISLSVSEQACNESSNDPSPHADESMNDPSQMSHESPTKSMNASLIAEDNSFNVSNKSVASSTPFESCNLVISDESSIERFEESSEISSSPKNVSKFQVDCFAESTSKSNDSCNVLSDSITSKETLPCRNTSETDSNKSLVSFQINTGNDDPNLLDETTPVITHFDVVKDDNVTEPAS